MSIKFTENQERAINEKGNILVAAAAGSGKTAVLVERVIRNITEKGFNIDEMLALTFTKAAASEMKEKILDAIYKKLEEKKNPHLSNQLVLINNANISTIHSFCFNVIKDHFYMLGIAPDIKVGENEELEVIKQNAIDETFEYFYNEKSELFLEYIFKFPGYRNDDNIKELILNIYNFLKTIPFYEDYILEVKEKLNKKDFFSSSLLKSFLNEIKKNILERKGALEKAKEKLVLEKNLYDEKKGKNIALNILLLEKDIRNLEKILEEENWDNLNNIFKNIEFESWKNNNIKSMVMDEAKDVRNILKKYLTSLYENIFSRTSEDILKENANFLEFLNQTFAIVLKFEEIYSMRKKEEKILDFADLENLSLKVLVRKKEENEEVLEKNIINLPYVKTEAAINLGKKFKEIQIDEYQDINTMQEYILNAVSNDNVFQVGDIKQSIYMFRNANPNLFLGKYLRYKDILNEEKIGKETEESKGKESKENKENKEKKIKLFQNFRSRYEVLDYTNKLFSLFMSENLGDINYTEEEYLNLGMNYLDENEKSKYIPETIYIETLSDNLDIEDIDEKDLAKIEEMTKIEYEAIYIKNEIEKLIKDEFKIFDKKTSTYRNIEYRDIVILLRSSKGKAGVIEKVLEDSNIPVYSEDKEGYLDSIETQKVIDYLKIIDNPSLDIPMLSILRSYFWNFSLSDILEVVIFANKYLKEKEENINISIYEKLKIYEDLENRTYLKEINIKYIENNDLREKVKNFLDKLEELKLDEKIYKIAYVVKKIIEDTGYIKYVLFKSNGKLKSANLKLFESKAEEYEKKGISSLKRFISYIERISLNLNSNESAQLISENENVVRIMTIHKSKGLEFPVVFLADTAKGVNKMDLSNEIIFDDKLGFAGDYIDGRLNIRYPTLLKEIFKEKKNKDLISEELRILYVALTRAREKLYMVGTIKEYAKYVSKLKKEIDAYSGGKYISDEYIKDNFSYLNLITLAKKYAEGLVVKEKVYTLEDLNLEEEIINNKKEKLLIQKIKEIEEFNLEEKNRELKEKQNEYLKYISELYSKNEKENNLEYEAEKNEKKDYQFLKKMSVSKIVQNEEEKINFERPKFIQRKSDLSGKEKGDLIHNIFKNMDFSKKWEKEEIEKYLAIEKASYLKYNSKEKEVLKEEIFIPFFMSDIYKRILESREVQKEENFYFLISENELKAFLNGEEINENLNKNSSENEKILIQGIIDLYFIDKNEDIILIDYKTDGSKNNWDLETQLISNYSKQLKLYSLILEKKYNKKVKEIYIYSVTLKKFIRIN